MARGKVVQPNENLRKAAVMAVLLGDEATSMLMKYLSEEEATKLSREISRLETVAPEEAETILEEFYQLQMAHSYFLQGGIEYAKKLLIKAYGPEMAKKLLDRIVHSLKPSGFDALQKADPQQLSKFIQNEHPQTIALILAHLDATQAAELLSSLPQDIRGDVVIRMANLEEISQEVIAKITSVLEQKLESIGTISRQAYGGLKAVAELVNRLDSAMGKELLEAVESIDPNLSLNIRNLMFVFDDILLLGDPEIREILQRVDKKVLTMALKGGSEEIRQMFFKNMSGRAVELMKEDMEFMGPVKLKDVELAQQEIIGIIRQLDEEGQISLKGAGGDQYIV